MDSNKMEQEEKLSYTDFCLQRIANYVFSDNSGVLRQLQQKHGSSWNTILTDFMHYSLAQQEKMCWESTLKQISTRRNRLGPNKVEFPEKKVEYDLMVADPMGLVAKENFVSVIANVGVYGGKWQYEVVIGSSGVMQVGWATRTSQFSAEKGVGDTVNSYSYDGNRQRSWNVSSRKYGDTWQSGDVITCGIDMDNRTISYFRNGRPLGNAFEGVASGPTYAYFPAVTLSKHEVLIVNFGGQPLLYPMPGYNVLEAEPSVQLQQAHTCMHWFRTLLQLALGDHLKLQIFREQAPSSEVECTLLSTAFQIMLMLKPLLMNVNAGAHLAHSVVLDFITRNIPPDFMNPAPGSSQVPPPDKHQLKELMFFLDIMHAAFDAESTCKVLQRVLLHIVILTHEPASSLQLPRHCHALRLLAALLLHDSTRALFVDRLLFVGVRLQSLFCYCVDERLMQELLPEVHWSSQDGALQCGNKVFFQSRLELLHNSLVYVEELHISVLSLLLTVEPDVPYTFSTRARFLRNLRSVTIKRNMGPARMLQVPMLPFFHSLLQTLGRLWVQELALEDRRCVPPHVFYEGSVSLLESNRLGGDKEHLMKNLAEQRVEALQHKHVVFGKEYGVVTPGKLRSVPSGACWVGGATMEVSEPGCSGSGSAHNGASSSGMTHNMHFSAAAASTSSSSADAECGGRASVAARSLHDLCDCAVLLYHHCVKRSLQRVGIAKESLNSAVARAADVTASIARMQAMSSPPAAVLSELQRSLALLHKDCDRQVMVQAWHRAVSFAPSRLAALVNLLHIVANTVKASESSGDMFAFLPDYYIEVLSHLSLGLADSFMIDYSVVEDEKSLYASIGVFLCRHFLDPRIRFTDSKDHLMQTVAFYVTCPTTLAVLEGLDSKSQEVLVQSLLQPYENRVWAQNNWILVRFWKGSGFAFRFHLSPHLKTKITPKPSYSDNCMQLIKPCPSVVLQATVARVLAGDAAASSRFISSLLNQLNWAFSEFIGMLQEIQNFSSRLERVFIDSRQLRICCTCFELTVSLLRVLEMVLTQGAQLFLGPPASRSAQPDVLLSMLCKLLCHVMNRVSVGSSGCFTRIVSLEIPGLDSLHHYPLLTAAAGILIALLKDDLDHQDDPDHDPVATKALVNEPSFQLAPFQALLDDASCEAGGSQPASYAGNLEAISVVASAPSHPAATAVTFKGPVPQTSASDASPEAMEVESDPSDAAAAASSNTQPQTEPEIRAFSLRQHPEDVSGDELAAVSRCIAHLQEYLRRPVAATPADDLQDCVICYAQRATALFLPCRHSSCRACISQHLMNHNECFFCTGTISSVIDSLTNKTIISKTNSLDSPEEAPNNPIGSLNPDRPASIPGFTDPSLPSDRPVSIPGFTDPSLPSNRPVSTPAFTDPSLPNDRPLPLTNSSLSSADLSSNTSLNLTNYSSENSGQASGHSALPNDSSVCDDR